MRGVHCIKSSPGRWAYFSSIVAESSTHIFLEKLLSGDRCDICVHFIVPTLFGMFLNEERVGVIAKGRDRSVPVWGDIEVLVKQEQCMASCAFCEHPLTQNELLPYQIALRVVVGTDDNYDVLFSLLCRKCQRVPWHSLLIISDRQYVPLCSNVAVYAFGDPIDLEDDQHIENLYMERIFSLNKHTQEIVRSTIVHPNQCYHCGRSGDLVRVCTSCECVSFCDRVSPDTRSVGKTCRELAKIYHDNWMCKSLREHALFDVFNSICITNQGAPEYVSVRCGD